MRMIVVARCLERIGDNAVDIGEQTAFVVTGEFHEFTDAQPLSVVGSAERRLALTARERYGARGSLLARSPLRHRTVHQAVTPHPRLGGARSRRIRAIETKGKGYEGFVQTAPRRRGDRRRRRLGALVSVAAAATSKPDLSKAAPRKLRGTITADGSSTVGPYTTAAAELFRRAGASKANITVGISGTGGGFERFCKGETDLSDASRPMRRTEAQSCKNNNVGSWRAFTVANDALTVVVSRDNTWATCLTVAELKKIWEPGSKVNNWNDVRASFPNEPLRLFGPGTDSGTFEYFTEAINGRARASRSDYQASEDDNVLVQGVAGNEGRPRLLRLLVLRGEPVAAQGAPGRRTRRPASA